MIESPVTRAALHWVPVILLIGAYGSWPYGYYTLLRIVVFLASVLLATDTYKRAGEATPWCLAFVGIAILFNPVFPIHLTRDIWGVVDPIIAVIIGAHYFLAPVRRDSEPND